MIDTNKGQKTYGDEYEPRKKRGLSPQRQRVLDFITDEITSGRPFPPHQVIASYMGWKSRSSVNQVLNDLHFFGHIKNLGRNVNQIVWGLA